MNPYVIKHNTQLIYKTYIHLNQFKQKYKDISLYMYFLIILIITMLSNCIQYLYTYKYIFDAILFYSILLYSIQFNSILFYSILFYPALSYPILSYPILFYSSLFYSILFYSILYKSTHK